ncbi:MAG: carboxylating nicotinate-nucleotide diphosphorylase [Candidatus Omnitrophica bacterium]|nr:carboxylating nicotinate-nucleotide diphosphorylase [Candidatus Omnitrophota bacterium]
MHLDKARALPIIKAALKEDIGRGDITTAPLIQGTASAGGVIVAREDCVVCGMTVAEWVMAVIDSGVRFKPNCADGASIGAGKELAFLEGRAGSILRAERTMLNFLSFLSGISTKTRAYADRVKPYGVKILDTRKTLPLLRYLEKYAVAIGGGANHRFGLYDQVLIKDNHIHLRRAQAASTHNPSLKSMVEEARAGNRRGTVIEIEVSTLEEFSDALAGRPDIIMLDNMRPEGIRACVEIRKLSKTKPLLEASGGMTLDRIEEYAKAGPDMISIGELTNSVKAIDISLDFT